MMAAFEDGTPVQNLMLEYGLGEKRVMAILADERNRRLTSPDPYYRRMREAMKPADTAVGARRAVELNPVEK